MSKRFGASLDLQIIIQEVQIQIPTSINLIFSCHHNEQKYETLKRRRIDGETKVANFSDQILAIPLMNKDKLIKENQTVSFNLMAVNEAKQKLIVIY
jgi:hypothetical protein